MYLDQAIASAVVPREPVAGAFDAPAEPRPTRASDELTLRQREVAALIAQGRSNRQIGEASVITERTAAAHIEHILNSSASSHARR
jgi:non-specific serine/threonine protein kinase